MIYTVTVYCGLGPKLGLVVKKVSSLARNLESSEARWSSSSQNISEVKGYSDWDHNVCVCVCVFPPLVMLALSGPGEALILMW